MGNDKDDKEEGNEDEGEEKEEGSPVWIVCPTDEGVRHSCCY